jgi:hypothetical protein
MPSTAMAASAPSHARSACACRASRSQAGISWSSHWAARSAEVKETAIFRWTVRVWRASKRSQAPSPSRFSMRAEVAPSTLLEPLQVPHATGFASTLAAKKRR